MSMTGYEVHECCECGDVDPEEEMKERGGFWYCKECDPGTPCKQHGSYECVCFASQNQGDGPDD